MRRDRADVAHIDVAALLNDALAALHGDLQSHAVATQTDLEAALPSVHASKAQLRQVFVNLIVNAMEAMTSIQSRPRRLLVSAHSTDGQVVVAISDSCPSRAWQAVQRIDDICRAANSSAASRVSEDRSLDANVSRALRSMSFSV